jgi:hypothetical protein
VHEHNRLRGQQEILAQFAELREVVFPPPIGGHLQHGWDVISPCPDAPALPHGLTSFVWSDSARNRLLRLGHGQPVPIGSPWLYLLERPDTYDFAVPLPNDPTVHVDSQQPADPGPRGTLWFPQHGIGGERTAEELAELIRTEHGRSDSVTVVLTRPDARLPGIRGSYEARGLEIATLPPAGRPAGVVGPNWYEALLLLLRAHLRVASNALHEAHLLGAAAGLIPVLRRDGQRSTDAALTGVGRDLLSLETAGSATEFAMNELGREHMLSRHDLRMLFDWRPDE